MSDELKKYLFHDQGTRVQAVKLTQAWQTGLQHQSFPQCVQSLLGELVSAAVLLASNLKLDGSLVLQLQGDGPVALIVVECTADLSIRATATLREGHEIPQSGTLQSLLNAHGQGRFIVILDPNKETTSMQPYQGIIPLEGETVAKVLELYMRNSEQLDTRLWLASTPEQSAGLLLQRLPGHGGTASLENNDAENNDDTWERAVALAGTITNNELLDLDTDALIHRLFWQETLIAFEPAKVSWSCPCTRTRVAEMLRMLGVDEIEDILSERAYIDVSCNFCGKPYRFDAVDCASLFRKGSSMPQTDTDFLH